jgi:TonB family protein
MFTKLRYAVRSAGVGSCLILLCMIAAAHPQDATADEGNGEKVYKSAEVDQKAVFDQRANLKNSPTGEGCEGQDQDQVRLRVVLHSSGKVTEVKVLKKAGCKAFEERAIRAAKMTKFKPAKKDGAAVSQYAILEYNYGTRGW